MPLNIVNQGTPETFGDVRRLILETVVNIRDGGLDVAQGMAIAANLKVLNGNIMAEIAATKLAMNTNNQAYRFGKVVAMGRKLIGSNPEVVDEVKEDAA